MRVHLYIRWSSAEQGKNSSLARQRDDCLAHLATRPEWTLTEELIDDGVSAYTGDNFAFGKLGAFARRAERGEFRAEPVTLLVERIDRFSRLAFDEVYERMCRMTRNGVSIATVDGARVYEAGKPIDFAALVELMVKIEVANQESEKKSDRVAKAWGKKRERLQNGDMRAMTGRCPAWLEIDPDTRRIALIDERALIVRRIFEETAAGLGKNQIARRLNLEGIPTWGTGKSRAEAWHASYVQKILQNPAVLGEYQPGRYATGAQPAVGDAIKGYFPAVVDAALHARATDRKAAKARQAQGQGRALANIFSGLATCDRCGSRMTYRNKGMAKRAAGVDVREDYLVCDGRTRGLCTHAVHYPYAALEIAVLDQVLHLALDDTHFERPDSIARIDIARAEAQRSLEFLRAKVLRARDMAASTDDPDDRAYWLDLKAKAATAAIEVRDLETALAEARGQVSPAEHLARVGEVRAMMEDSDEETRRVARARVMHGLKGIVESMTFMAKGPRIGIRLRSGIRNVILSRDGRVVHDFDFTETRTRDLSTSREEAAAVAGIIARTRKRAA